jgi:hypothetical protein
MRRQIVATVLFLLPLAPGSASAGAELTLSAGLRTGVIHFTTEAYSPLILCVTTPCVTADVTTEEDQIRLSLILDAPVSPRWMVEVLYTEQDGDHRFQSDFPDIVEEGSYEWTTVQIGALRQWGEGEVRPFAAAALGVSQFESTVPRDHPDANRRGGSVRKPRRRRQDRARPQGRPAPRGPRLVARSPRSARWDALAE